MCGCFWCNRERGGGCMAVVVDASDLDCLHVRASVSACWLVGGQLRFNDGLWWMEKTTDERRVFVLASNKLCRVSAAVEEIRE